MENILSFYTGMAFRDSKNVTEDIAYSTFKEQVKRSGLYKIKVKKKTKRIIQLVIRERRNLLSRSMASMALIVSHKFS